MSYLCHNRGEGCAEPASRFLRFENQGVLWHRGYCPKCAHELIVLIRKAIVTDVDEDEFIVAEIMRR